VLPGGVALHLALLTHDIRAQSAHSVIRSLGRSWGDIGWMGVYLGVFKKYNELSGQINKPCSDLFGSSTAQKPGNTFVS
jgi:hypothetical protein